MKVLELASLLKAPGKISEIATLLKKGAIILYPTETLYGIGGDPFAPGDPIERIARLKRRPPDQPFIYLIPDKRFLEENGILLPKTGENLMDHFWPGPITLILPIPSTSPLAGIAHEGSLAVRVSPHPFVQALFRHHRFPLISTSANLSGAPEDEARNPDKILETFGNSADLFVTEGPLQASPPSTLLDLRASPPKLIREGALPFEKILTFI